MPDLYDQDLRLLRRDRAAQLGPVDFLHRRAFEDILDRLSIVRRSFTRVLLLGCPSAELAAEARAQFVTIDLIEPSPVLSEHIDASQSSDVALSVEPGSYDLIVSLGTLGDSDDPQETLLRFRFALARGGLCLGAFVGGDSLPALRGAMRAADEAAGQARPHVHPRIDPAALTQLLTNAGFSEPVVDVDRVEVRYPSLAKLVADLRRMGTGNFLRDRPRSPIGRSAHASAEEHFSARSSADGKTSEFFEIVHFAGWRNSAENN